MNASPANLNPVNPVQTPSAGGKPQDSASDTPFSQVLSSEIAQNQRSSQTRKSEAEKADPGAEETAEAVDPATASTIPAVKTDNTQIDAAFDMLRAEGAPVSPATFLALAIPANPTQSEPSSLDDAVPENLVAQFANPQAGRESKKGLASKALQAAQLGDAAVGSQKSDPAQPAKTGVEFTAQLAAARQSDSMKAGEQLSDLISNPAMRAAPHSPVEAPTPLNGAMSNRLAPSVGTTAWGQALGEKIVWMAAGTQQTASLTLNPPNLGPLQIVLNISNDQATASFFSAQPEVRQALEAAFPRLREMMNEAGIQLGQATVSADTPQQHAFDDHRSQRVIPPFSGVDETSPAGLQAIQSPVLRSGRGLVDTFA